MKLPRIALSLMLLGAASLAQAHTHLHKSTPANGAELKEAPKTLSLSFEDAVHLTAVTLEVEGDKSQQQLKPLPSGDIADAVVPMPALAPGKYLVTWHAASKDGHVMSGKIKFDIVKP
jgi:methionine-rich copper-binding protein CopC